MIKYQGEQFHEKCLISQELWELRNKILEI